MLGGFSLPLSWEVPWVLWGWEALEDGTGLPEGVEQSRQMITGQSGQG